MFYKTIEEAQAALEAKYGDNTIVASFGTVEEFLAQVRSEGAIVSNKVRQSTEKTDGALWIELNDSTKLFIPRKNYEAFMKDINSVGVVQGVHVRQRYGTDEYELSIENWVSAQSAKTEIVAEAAFATA